MIKLILIFLIASALPFIVYSQVLRDIVSKDSVVTKTQTNDAKLLFLSPLFSRPLLINEEMASYPKSLHLEFGSSSNSMQSIFEQNLDVSGIWKIGALKDEELKTLRSILGSVQLGGVAYLAYRHIKKYGLK